MMDNTAQANAPERLSTFQLGRYHFGVDIQYLKEVVPLPEYTPLPNVEDIYLGVFNLRGEIFPIADISPLLGMNPKPIYADDMVMLKHTLVGWWKKTDNSILYWMSIACSIPMRFLPISEGNQNEENANILEIFSHPGSRAGRLCRGSSVCLCFHCSVHCY